ncbi:hypothetical protein T02_6043 [Trichinella nativa]|uniref:Uncharacterized protein n=1 Tax=Trichinella nativa TaxID=6335 RepID=A0A0V1LL86_9BILA|nr:hypothetical protein T02_6043 [Trichinella nativa]
MRQVSTLFIGAVFIRVGIVGFRPADQLKLYNGKLDVTMLDGMATSAFGSCGLFSASRSSPTLVVISISRLGTMTVSFIRWTAVRKLSSALTIDLVRSLLAARRRPTETSTSRTKPNRAVDYLLLTVAGAMLLIFLWLRCFYQFSNRSAAEGSVLHNNASRKQCKRLIATSLLALPMSTSL